MSLTWTGLPAPPPARPGLAGWLRLVVRAPLVIGLLTVGLAVKSALRLPEALVCGPRRPATPWVTVAVCRMALPLLGLRVRRRGAPMTGPGLAVSNHASWLDIFVLNAVAPVVFVSKAEVAHWPGIGLLARATGTLFVRREARSQAADQAAAIARRIALGQRPLLFPEGTSTDGRRVLRFRSALFAALGHPLVPPDAALQPITLRWRPAHEGEAPLHAWWGDAAFGPHALAVLAAPGGQVEVVLHRPIPARGQDRKTLAAAAERAVRSAL